MKPRVFAVLRQTLPSLLLVAASAVLIAITAQGQTISSRTIQSVLRQPLPPEELSVSRKGRVLTIAGPTFIYELNPDTGVISGLKVSSQGRELIASTAPAELRLDGYELNHGRAGGGLEIISRGKGKVVVRGRGMLSNAGLLEAVPYELLHTFFNDGVVVSDLKLTPTRDLAITNAISFHLPVTGVLTHYIHKRRDEHGDAAVRGPLPEGGKGFRTSTLTSCLQVFSPEAALAIFTDSGAMHLSKPDLDSAAVDVLRKQEHGNELSLRQYVVHVAPGDAPYVIKAGQDFSFRVGISVAPNRLAHPRLHDLRMFAWIGDTNYPYASDQEIAAVAQAGYTVFQMHRLGNPGEPRPPAGELDRVINKVHQAGMLFLWTENADLMYDSAPGVQAMKRQGKWALWEGFNYGGRYKATMDPYCDLAATCLASPNGLADYRLACIARMTDRYKVDGMYLDDNLGYANCTRWREHGHPQQVYDCLIELHEMNWRRRELLRSKCPHAVLVSHNTRATILPVVCDFDAQLYGEGYSFGSLENYWNYYVPVQATPSQGMIWPGGQDPVRCAAAVAYNFDLLSGGGQYCEIDWRLFANKFPYGEGVTASEPVYVQTYNLAQYYFGMYESKPYLFGNWGDFFTVTNSLVYGSVYRNQVWGDLLIVIANMNKQAQNPSVIFHSPEALGLVRGSDYLLYQTEERAATKVSLYDLPGSLAKVSLPAQGLRLWALRPMSSRAPCHIWGGKRMSETWDSKKRKLSFSVQGPAGLEDHLFVYSGAAGIQKVTVDGRAASFSHDPEQHMVHGKVQFGSRPMTIEVFCSATGSNALPERRIPPNPIQSVSK